MMSMHIHHHTTTLLQVCAHVADLISSMQAAREQRGEPSTDLQPLPKVTQQQAAAMSRMAKLSAQ